MKDICIIGIYFGNVPPNFKLWLKSCEYNSDIDFIVVGDFLYEKFPDNVKYINMTMSQFMLLAEKELNCKIYKERSYKLCDLKPVYGYILKKYIQGYSYWGHCDFDLIFGDLKKFLTKYNLTKYDKFLPLGHLCFYKNDNSNKYLEDTSTEMNAIEIFNSKYNCLFDEIGINKIYKKYNFFDEIIFADINPAYRKFLEVEYLSYYPEIYTRYKLKVKKINYKYQAFYYDNGCVYKGFVNDKGIVEVREYMYIHMQKRKEREDNIYIDKENLNYFIIDKKIIEKNNGIPSIDIIKQLTPSNSSVYIDKIFYLANKIKRYINKKIKKVNYDNIIIPKDVRYESKR